MKALLLLPVAAFGLAACNPSGGVQTTVPTPTGPASATSFRSSPPDNPTGSQVYQSPDLDSRHPLPGQNR